MSNGAKRPSTASSVWTAVGFILIMGGVFAFFFTPILFLIGEIPGQAMASTVLGSIMVAAFGVASVIIGDHF